MYKVIKQLCQVMEKGFTTFHTRQNDEELNLSANTHPKIDSAWEDELQGLERAMDMVLELRNDAGIYKKIWFYNL